jgi:hypothetical protein
MMGQIVDLANSDRLYLIVKEFAAVDLPPEVVSGRSRRLTTTSPK